MTMTFAPAPRRQHRAWQRTLLGGLCALVLLPLSHAQRVVPTPQANAQAQAPLVAVQPPRTLTWQVPEARTPIELRRLDVQATIVGRTAATRIELELFNPNSRMLEAQLQFPLAEGQSVTGFAPKAV